MPDGYTDDPGRADAGVGDQALVVAHGHDLHRGDNQRQVTHDQQFLRDKADLDLLEPLVKKELAKRNPVALSALLVAYLNIKGPEGLTMLEKDVMSANLERRANGLEALRVHASETRPIPLQQILPIMRKQLKQPDLAGPVIQDLAFLRDWKVLPDIVALTQQPKSKVDAWVRVDRAGVENYQITLGGDAGPQAAIGDKTGPGFAYDEVVPAIERILRAYLALRDSPAETFIDAFRRLGAAPFKEALYGENRDAA